MGGPKDDHHGAPNPVAVLEYGFWKDRLGAQLDVLNQPLRINGPVFTIAGIARRQAAPHPRPRWHGPIQ